MSGGSTERRLAHHVFGPTGALCEGGRAELDQQVSAGRLARHSTELVGQSQESGGAQYLSCCFLIWWNEISLFSDSVRLYQLFRDAMLKDAVTWLHCCENCCEIVGDSLC
jgi:hypothetical protein